MKLKILLFAMFVAGALSQSAHADSRPQVDVQCKVLTLPVKLLESIGFQYLGDQSIPGFGVFNKNQLDVFWNALKGKSGVLIEDLGEITVKSGESGEIKKGYDFTYPLTPLKKPSKMKTCFIGSSLKLQPVVSRDDIDISLKFRSRQLKEIQADLSKKPTFDKFVSALPKNTIFNPVFHDFIFDYSVILSADQSVCASLDAFDLAGQKMKFKDTSNRRFLIITAKVIKPSAS